MGNKLSCSCTPLPKKGYKDDDAPFKPPKSDHQIRLWAEVFHVTSAETGIVRWQQVSHDLVPVLIQCIRDQPNCVFRVTAHNSLTEKILDVTIRQPGTRLGQASECFVYWKDTSSTTGQVDTWGLNFTSSTDAQHFRNFCSATYKFSRKASSSYSLRLNEPPSKQRYNAILSNATQSGAKRKPQSTPSSPSRRAGGGGGGGGGNMGIPGSEGLQCTCMTVDTLHKQRNGRVRYAGATSSTLPKSFRQDSGGSQSTAGSARNISAYPSTTSVNLAGGQGQQGYYRPAGQTSRPGSSMAKTGQQQQASSGRSAQYSRMAQFAQSSKRSSTMQSRSFDLPSSHPVTQQQQQQQIPQAPPSSTQQQQQQQIRDQQQQQRGLSFPYHPPYHRSAPSHVNAQQANAASRAAGAGPAAAGGSSAQAAAIAAAQQQQQQQQQSSRSKSSEDVRRQLSSQLPSDEQAMDGGGGRRRGQQQQQPASRAPRPTSGPPATGQQQQQQPYTTSCGDPHCTQGQCKMPIPGRKGGGGGGVSVSSIMGSSANHNQAVVSQTVPASAAVAAVTTAHSLSSCTTSCAAPHPPHHPNQNQFQSPHHSHSHHSHTPHHRHYVRNHHLTRTVDADDGCCAAAESLADDRSRLSRSETGRRRSLERMQCFDFTDMSPTTADKALVPMLSGPSVGTPTPSASNRLIPSPDQGQQQQQQSQQQSQQKAKQSQSQGQQQRQTRGRPQQRSTSGATPSPGSSGDEGQQQQQQVNGTSTRPIRSSMSAPPASVTRTGSPTIKVLQEYEHHLRTALAKGTDADTYSLNTFETILSQSMENVVALMKEVQSEIEAIRREESHYRCTSAFGFRPSPAAGLMEEAAYFRPPGAGRNPWSRSYTLPSRGTSLPPTGSEHAYQSAVRKASTGAASLFLDTLSVDGMQYLRPQSSFESTASDSRMYLTSSEVSTFVLYAGAFLVRCEAHVYVPLLHGSAVRNSLNKHTSERKTIRMMMMTWRDGQEPGSRDSRAVDGEMGGRD